MTTTKFIHEDDPAPADKPSEALITMTIFDWDGGASGEYTKTLTFPEFEYYKTPLRAASGDAITSTLLVDTWTEFQFSIRMANGLAQVI